MEYQLFIPKILLANSDLSSTSKLLYSIIANDCFNKGLCTKTTKELAALIGVVPLAVTNSIRKMTTDGLVNTHGGVSKKNRPQYSYSICSDKLKEFNETNS